MPCPHARHEPGTMRVLCDKAAVYCGNQYYKSCKGWWVLNDNAARCPLRASGINGEEKTNG